MQQGFPVILHSITHSCTGDHLFTLEEIRQLEKMLQ